jgi:23S rRNA (pseudouridine1915-N3)-methyltransferase
MRFVAHSKFGKFSDNASRAATAQFDRLEDVRLILATIGKLKASADRELFERYWQRFDDTCRSAGITAITLIELPESRAQTATERQADEARRLLKSFGLDVAVITLDESGIIEDSIAFARRLKRMADSGQATLAIAIGGPDGHGAEMRARAATSLSLGRLTLPHGLARIVIAEQLYRATTILSGHPYHRG